ncbi:MAG TPA: DNA recombination protein RmuC [Ignavibacteria bacterium]|nr:DNA recombination protein RmuC [Ignavibacteria bacterium]
MRQTVDEKLQTTLEKRLSESFRQVSDRLEQVHKGLGEMQNLASGVGDLKKVLSNVKTRGVLGEIQLENILEQFLSPDQYVKNYKSSKGFVEFAIKIPNKDNDNTFVFIPIDSKFPMDLYSNLQDAYDSGDVSKIELARKYLTSATEKNARDICDKYISPPETTDFAIMFLPVEGLFAEITRTGDFIYQLQSKYKITIAGPTTLISILSAYQMGFRSLSIEKRSSEVWKVLGEVKNEFGKFADLLEKTKKKIDGASEDIGDLLGKRTKAISRKLKDVEELPSDETKKLSE